MTICGYNEIIGEAIRKLADGMAVELEKKAKVTSPKEAMERELAELPTIINIMKKDASCKEINMFIGLNLLALPLFEYVNSRIDSQSKVTEISRLCKLGASDFITILEHTEMKSYSLQNDDIIYSNPITFAEHLANYAISISQPSNEKIRNYN